MNEYLAIDNGGWVCTNNESSRINYNVAESFPVKSRGRLIEI